ncbi:MAG: DUF4845 domain-containing protein [Acidiferrobacteraceae bacterium]
MFNRRRQTGITLFGMVLVVFVVVFFTLLVLKLLPAYLNNFKVKSDLKNLVQQPNASRLSMSEIMDGLERRFEIDEVSYVHLSKNLTVTRIAGGKRIVIRYSVLVPMFYNVSAIVNFDDHVEAVHH